MIVYKLTDGFAHDLRYEQDDYALQVDDIKFADGFGTLPALASLHDPLAVQAKRDAEDAERLRRQNLRGDALAAELLDRLQAATPAQISSYVDANVTDLASARVMFKRVLLVLLVLAAGGG